MRKYLYIALLFAIMEANAQSTYEAIRFVGNDIVGTSRFIGMGGSMSALGADISVMGTNPAGIGLYRSNDVSLSAGLSTLNADAGGFGKTDNTFFSLDNVGVVLVNSLDNSSFKFVNVGLSYSKRKNLEREFSMMGCPIGGFSQMYQMQQLYDAQPFDIANITYRNYTSLNNSWLALLAADGGLLYEGYIDDGGNIIDQGALNFTSDNMEMAYHSEEKGGVEEVALNLSCNINDRAYLGITVGFQSVDYSRYSYYGEDDEIGPIYTLYNWYNTQGSGFDVKLGAIFRPFEESPFRVGVSVASPTFYSLTDRMSACIDGLMYDAPTGEYLSTYMDTRSADAYGDDFYVDYKLNTPWIFNLSAAYTFGSSLALNAEYEYSDYSQSRMEYSDGFEMSDMNEEFESNLKAVGTLKIGAEYNIDKNFSLRCGFYNSSAAFNKNAAKYNITNVDTNTEYLNTFETMGITLGMGYRGETFYFDAAYRYESRDAEFYPFYDSYKEDNVVYTVSGTDVNDTRNQLIMTVGMRF